MNRDSSHESATRANPNPYFADSIDPPSQQALDAAAPDLSVAESRRLNKKALMFLGGIALLVMTAGFILLRAGATRNDEVARAEPRKERVEVPRAPSTPMLPDTPGQTDRADAAQPVALASHSTPPLPPMPQPPPVTADAYPMEHRPSLLERRTAAEPAQRPSHADPQSMQGQQLPAQLERTPATSAVFLRERDTLLLRGTYIRCALETRVITDVDGFTSCVVTEPVYSVNGLQLLLPKGSRVLGQYGSGAIRGERVAVVWDRIVTPTGIDVTMSSPGIDNLGSAGHPGDYSAHWGSRIASALFISLLSDAFKYYGEKEGQSTTTAYPGTGSVVEQPFQSNTARTVERLAQQAVEQGANRPPTVTINQGSIVSIYVSRDVDFGGVIARHGSR